jgi:hypothetical protein
MVTVLKMVILLRVIVASNPAPSTINTRGGSSNE